LRNKNLGGETVMKRYVSITCDFDLAIGKANLNEIVYRLKKHRDSFVRMMLRSGFAVVVKFTGAGTVTGR
jgi:hypothetical protein